MFVPRSGQRRRPNPTISTPDTTSQRTELVRPSVQPDGHDFPRTVDERIPGIAAVIDDIVVGFEDAVQPKEWFQDIG